VVLKLKTSLNFAELHEEFYILKPTLWLFFNGGSKQTLSVNDRWCCIILAAGIITFICSIYPCMQRSCGASFSIMNCYWRNEHSTSSTNLIKSEIVIKVNYKYTCKVFYTFVLMEKDILETAKSNKKHVLNS
jgi:hypothetical protein